MLRRDIIDVAGWAWGQIKGLRHCFFVNCLIGFARVLISLLFVWVCKHIVDIATQKSDGDIVLWMCVMVAVIISQLAINMYLQRYREKNRLDISNQLRYQLFGSVMRSRWNGDSSLHSGDTVNRLEEDIKTLCATINETLPSLFIMAFQLICASVFLFAMQAGLLWVLLVIMPVALVVSKIYYRRLRKLNGDIRRLDSDIQSHIQENILKRVLILSMVRVEECMDLLSGLQGSLSGLSMDRVVCSSRARMLVSLGFMAGYCVTFCWGAFGIVEGTITYGMMTAFLQLVNQVQNPIVNMSRQLPQLIQTVTSVERLRELSALQQESADGQHIMRGPLGIRIENLCFSYQEADGPVIDNLSYDFAPGVSTAIIGGTGTGKSTLMRLLLDIIRPQKGRVVVYGGGEALDMNPSLRCNFQYVPQGNSLIPGTLRQNLLLGNPDASDGEMQEALRIACADFVMSRPEGLDTKCSEQGVGLSEGQAQRIAIARALLQPGRIMLMDEACSALDTETERRVLENLKRCCEDRTIIWITHHVAVREYMDRCLVLGL